MNTIEVTPFTLPSLLLVERRDLPDCSAIYFVTHHTSSLGGGSVTGCDGSVTGKTVHPSQPENLIGQKLQPLEGTSVTGVTGKTEITRWRRKYFLFPLISQLKKLF